MIRVINEASDSKRKILSDIVKNYNSDPKSEGTAKLDSNGIIKIEGPNGKVIQFIEVQKEPSFYTKFKMVRIYSLEGIDPKKDQIYKRVKIGNTPIDKVTKNSKQVIYAVTDISEN